jgi:hypothetical protein
VPLKSAQKSARIAGKAHRRFFYRARYGRKVGKLGLCRYGLDVFLHPAQKLARIVAMGRCSGFYDIGCFNKFGKLCFLRYGFNILPYTEEKLAWIEAKQMTKVIYFYQTNALKCYD